MICYNLQCQDCQHTWESWFKNIETCEKLIKTDMVNCENCSSTEVSKAPMAPSVQSNTQMQPSDKFLSALRAYVNKSFHDVGNDFADTVRKISSGEMEPRPIRGTASKEDYDQLLDEGHDVIKLMLKKDN